jgi:hypothetical protein
MNFKFLRGKKEESTFNNIDAEAELTALLSEQIVGGVNTVTANPMLTFEMSEPILRLSPLNQSNIEFCFQFNNTQPKVFASSSERLIITLEPNLTSSMTFSDDEGNTFKLFTREIV